MGNRALPQRGKGHGGTRPRSGSPGTRAPRELRGSRTLVPQSSLEPAPTQPHVARGARLVARASFRARGASPPQPVQPLLPTVFIRGRRAEAEASSPVPVAVACTVAAAASHPLSRLRKRGRARARAFPPQSFPGTMNPNCARCGKIVYPTEKVNCLDKVSSSTRRRELASASAVRNRGRKEGLGLCGLFPAIPRAEKEGGRRLGVWGQTPGWNPGGPGRGGGQPPLEKGGLCASGLGGLEGREGTGEPGSPGCVPEVRGAVPPPKAGSARGDGRSLSPRRPAPSRRKRGALGEGAAGAGRRLGPALPAGLGLLLAWLPGLEAASGPSSSQCQLW